MERFRDVVLDCMSKHLYLSAIFFPDKVAAFTSDPADIYMQAQVQLLLLLKLLYSVELDFDLLPSIAAVVEGSCRGFDSASMTATVLDFEN
ncbi:anaphase-promoting complex subunit 6 [Tanacetum coccineum]